MQRKPENSSETSSPAVSDRFVQDIGVGQPLDARTRGFFENRFGHDFSQVRLHTDAKAAESARSVKAMAYTLGHNIVFGTGKYDPATMTGQRLLAHELTHVLQQKESPKAGSATVQRQAEGSEPTTQGLLNPVTEKGKTCSSAEKGFSRKEPESPCPSPLIAAPKSWRVSASA